MEIKQNWTDFKAIVDSKGLNIQFEETESSVKGTMYFLIGIDSTITYNCNINDTDNASDITDFEDNYKNDSNQSLTLPRLSKAVTVTGMALVTGKDQTIVEYTVPANKTFYLTDIAVGGAEIDRKGLLRNSVVKWRAYHSANDSKVHELSTPIRVNSGITIKVTNQFATGGRHVATLLGVLDG